MPTFDSKNRNLRLVRRPHREMTNAIGQQVTVQETLRYLFTDGVLEIAEGVDPLPDGAPILVDGEFTGEQQIQDAVTWLRNHPLRDALGNEAWFVERGREPDAIPDPIPVLNLISDLVLAQDTDGIEQILHEEREGYQRPTVIAQAEHWLGRLEQIKAQQEATA